MTEERCTMAPLVEARRDGRLDAREVASVERHLAACAACRALTADSDRLTQVARLPATGPATPLEHQRGRVALLRAAAGAEPANERATARRLTVVLAAAAALAVTGAVSAGAIAWFRHPAPDAVAVARRLPPPPVLAARLDTTVRGAPGARFERTRVAEVERVALAEGAIDLEVRPLAPGERFLVATDDAEVEVRGTVFHVEAHERHLTYVSVREGKVEVRRGTESVLLTPGQEWRDDRPHAEIAPAPPPKQARATVAARSVAAHDKPPPAARSASGFAEGVRLVERGDYAAAAERLEAFHADHPGDARGEDAAFLTVIALQRAGRQDEARAAAHRYLAQYPKGYHCAEAEAVVAGQ